MPRKGRNIYKRKDGRWEGRFIRSRDDSGKAVYGYVYGKTYNETKIKLEQTAVAPKIFKKEVSQTFGFWAEQWYQKLQPQVKKSTEAKYYSILHNHLLPAFSGQKISDLTNCEVERFVTHLAESNNNQSYSLSPKTISDILSVMRSVLRYSIRNGQSCAIDIQEIQIKQILPKMRVLSWQEQEILCRHICQEVNGHSLGILLCLYTGLRVGEVCALRWEDISLQAQVIHVRHSSAV